MLLFYLSVLNFFKSNVGKILLSNIIIFLSRKASQIILRKLNYFRESLEDENLKLMEMVRQRETTIKKLESRTRNALEISIKADDG